MTRLLLSSLLVTVTVCAASPARAYECFEMFDARNTRVLQTATSPIDLSKSISDQMAARYPSRYLIISDNGSCNEINVATAVPASGVLSLRSEADFAGTSPAPTQPRPITDVAPGRRIARGHR